jgi:hypothetical protein
LYGLLQAGAAVDLLCVEGEQIPNLEVEHLTRQRLKREIRKYISNVPGSIRSFNTITLERNTTTADRLLLAQTLLLLGGALLHVKPDVDVVLQAYVMGDDAISFLPELQRWWSAHHPLLGRNTKRTRLEFPFSKVHKVDLASFLNATAVGNTPLKWMNWACERPDVISTGIPHACGACPSCLLVERHRLQSYHLGYVPFRDYEGPEEATRWLKNVSHFRYMDGGDSIVAVRYNGTVHRQPIKHGFKNRHYELNEEWSALLTQPDTLRMKVNSLEWGLAAPREVYDVLARNGNKDRDISSGATPTLLEKREC